VTSLAVCEKVVSVCQVIRAGEKKDSRFGRSGGVRVGDGRALAIALDDVKVGEITNYAARRA
jgi:hypothetical protein